MLQTRKLTNEATGAVMDFLSRQPIHSFGFSSFISRNTLENPQNQGTFYGCFDITGQLEAVALLGRFSLLQTASVRALKEIARIARQHTDLHLLIAEKNLTEKFWRLFRAEKKFLRNDVQYVLLVKEQISPPEICPPELKLATSADLENVVNAHAQVTQEDRGFNPLELEPESFRKRCLERIQANQTWIYTKNNSVVFKAELMCHTPDLAYVEAIWIAPKFRRRGYGLRCLNELSRKLLEESKAVCLLTEAKSSRKISFYHKAGFEEAGEYTASFLKSIRPDDK